MSNGGTRKRVQFRQAKVASVLCPGHRDVKQAHVFFLLFPGAQAPVVTVITQLNPGDISAFLFYMEQCRVCAILATFGKDGHGNHDDIVFKPFGCVHCHDLDEVLITFQSELSVFGR